VVTASVLVVVPAVGVVVANVNFLLGWTDKGIRTRISDSDPKTGSLVVQIAFVAVAVVVVATAHIVITTEVQSAPQETTTTTMIGGIIMEQNQKERVTLLRNGKRNQTGILSQILPPAGQPTNLQDGEPQMITGPLQRRQTLPQYSLPRSVLLKYLGQLHHPKRSSWHPRLQNHWNQPPQNRQRGPPARRSPPTVSSIT